MNIINIILLMSLTSFSFAQSSSSSSIPNYNITVSCTDKVQLVAQAYRDSGLSCRISDIRGLLTPPPITFVMSKPKSTNENYVLKINNKPITLPAKLGDPALFMLVVVISDNGVIDLATHNVYGELLEYRKLEF